VGISSMNPVPACIALREILVHRGSEIATLGGVLAKRLFGDATSLTRSPSQKNVESTPTTITKACRRVGNNVATHSSAIQPPLDVLFEHSLAVHRVMAATVDDPDTSVTEMKASADKFIESFFGLLNGKSV
jgi:hypothetical protein